MRSSFLLILGMLALAAACGGQTGGIGNGDGGSNSSSSGSGSGGSSGGISSSSGSSSGGTTCAPLPGCSSSVECPSPNGCDFCYCEGGEWACGKSGCLDASPFEDAPYTCPAFAPPGDSVACSDIGAQCFYPSDAGCGGGDACFCQPSGTWACDQSTCFDSGQLDGGFFDSGDGCPQNQPPNNEACSTQGNVCSYFTSCETNCLCASTGWVCATQQNCGDF